MRALRLILRLCAGLGLLLLLGGFAGALHPVGDSLAVFRLFLAAGVLATGLMLLALRDRWWGLYFVVLAAVAGIAPVGTLLPSDDAAGSEGGSYSLYQKNLLFQAREAEAILAEIDAMSPDFLTLQEVSAANRAAVFDRLPGEYHRAICSFSGVGAVAIASRHPIVTGSVLCIERSGMLAAQVETPDGRVWLTSIHLHWPWPYRQAEQVAQILPLLARMEGPVMIGGDFNMVRWGHLMGEFERASGSLLADQGRPTFRLTYGDRTGPGFEIDHVLLPDAPSARVERLDFLGSDHRGLLARFAL